MHLIIFGSNCSPSVVALEGLRYRGLLTLDAPRSRHNGARAIVQPERVQCAALIASHKQWSTTLARYFIHATPKGVLRHCAISVLCGVLICVGTSWLCVSLTPSDEWWASTYGFDVNRVQLDGYPTWLQKRLVRNDRQHVTRTSERVEAHFRIDVRAGFPFHAMQYSIWTRRLGPNSNTAFLQGSRDVVDGVRCAIPLTERSDGLIDRPADALPLYPLMSGFIANAVVYAIGVSYSLRIMKDGLACYRLRCRRCIACGYLLINRRGLRCPECGELTCGEEEVESSI